MLRVCMVLHHCEAPFGGPELQALRIAKRMIANGHKIIFLARGSGKAPKFEVLDGVPVYRMNTPGLASIEILWLLYRLKDCFDVIHVHSTGRLASAAIQFAKWFDKRIFVKVTMNGCIKKPANSGIKRILKRLSPFPDRKVDVLKQADGMIAITQSIVSELKLHGFPPDKINYIPNGVDMEVFHPNDPQTKRQIRLKLSLPVDKVIYLFTGKVTKRKGIDTLLDAWNAAQGIRGDSLLLIIGSGKGQKDSLEAYAQQFITNHHLGNSVLCIGEVDHVHDYLSASDIFVFPSRWEGLPNSLLEAMACGLYCIGSNIEGNSQLITNEKTGVLVPAGEVHYLKSAIELAFAQHQSVNYGHLASDLIRDEYSIHSTIKRIVDLFGRTSEDVTRGLLS